MPKAPKNLSRPAAGTVGAAQTATRDFPADDGKDKAAQSLGQRGGQARAKALSPERRKEIAQKGATARWKT